MVKSGRFFGPFETFGVLAGFGAFSGFGIFSGLAFSVAAFKILAFSSFSLFDVISTTLSKSSASSLLSISNDCCRTSF